MPYPRYAFMKHRSHEDFGGLQPAPPGLFDPQGNIGKQQK